MEPGTVCQHPAGNGSYQSWLSLCWGSCARFKDSSFQSGFASTVQLFRNPTALPISLLNLNGPCPSPGPDLGSWAGAAGGGQAGRRGIPHCPESDSGSWERITAAFRTFPRPKQHQHNTSVPFPSAGKAGGGGEGRTLPKPGVAGE